MKNLLILVMCFFSIPVFAQDMSMSDFVSQLVTDAMNLKGASHSVMALGVIALVIRALLSTLKVSALRGMWDKLSVTLQGMIPLVLSVLLVLVTSLKVGEPITIQMIGVALFTGAGASKLHDLLQYIEALPGINKTVQFVVMIGETLLGGGK